MTSNKDIFSSILEFSYQSKLPKINYKEFEKVINSRRSVRAFTNEKIPDDIIKKSLNNALIAPNSSNLQVWEIYWVKNNDSKKNLIKACLSQPAASTAKELFVFVARPDNWKRNNKLMLEYLKRNKIKSKSVNHYYSKITSLVYNQGYFNILGYILVVVECL